MPRYRELAVSANRGDIHGGKRGATGEYAMRTVTTTIPAAGPIIGPEDRAAVDRVMATGMLAQGPEVAAFEAEFSAVVGGRSCVAVN
jgi:hypothetical protein